MDNFKRRAVVSLFSSYASQFATTATNLATKLLLARLISPSDLGTYALALLVLMACDLFIDLGVSQHLTREEERPYGNVLLMRLVSASILYCLIQLFAQHANFWGTQFPPVLKVLSIVMIIKAASWVPNVFIDRELIIHRSVLPQFARLLVNGILSVFLARLHMGVWALVYGTIAGEVIFGIAIWKAAWKRIPLEFTWRHTLALVSGSRFLLLIAIMGFALQQGDIAIIGSVLNSKQVGYYTMAYTFVVMVSKIIETSIYRVIYPTFCEYKNSEYDLGRIYRQATLIITAIEAPIYFFLFFNAQTLVPVFLGKKWIPAAALMQGLSITGIINPFSTFGSEVLRAKGMDRTLTLSTVISAVTFVVSGYFLTRHFGAIGMVAANYIIVGSIPIVWSVYKMLKTDFQRLCRELAIVYTSALAVMWIAAWVFSSHRLIGSAVAGLLMLMCWYIYYKKLFNNVGSNSVSMLFSFRRSEAREAGVES